MNQLMDAIAWLGDPAHWSGRDGITTRLIEHLGYSALALVVAALIAIPLGGFIGHTGRLRGIAVVVSGGLRALPSLGLLTWLALTMGLGLSWSIVPSTIALAVLAIPPLLASTYAGVEAIDPSVIDGARGAGFSERQIVTRVELPLAGPMVLGGVRSATLQVLATATISAYLGLGGLGRYILDGLPVRDYPKMLAGALLVIVCALALDGLLAVAQRVSISPGVRAATRAPERGKS